MMPSTHTHGSGGSRFSFAFLGAGGGGLGGGGVYPFVHWRSSSLSVYGGTLATYSVPICGKSDASLRARPPLELLQRTHRKHLFFILDRETEKREEV